MLTLSGDGPFIITSRCFVDQPQPPGPGFVACPECGSHKINAYEQFEISCSPDMWSRAHGRIEVQINDTKGSTRKLVLAVLADTDNNQGAQAVAAM